MSYETKRCLSCSIILEGLLLYSSRNSYEFLDEYNNNPSKIIEQDKHLLVSYDNTRKCFCKCSKIELINLLQKSLYNENKNKNEFIDLRDENNNLNQKLNQALNVKIKIEKEIKQVKEEKSKLEKEIGL